LCQHFTYTHGFLTVSTHEWFFRSSSDIIRETNMQTGKQRLMGSAGHSTGQQKFAERNGN